MTETVTTDWRADTRAFLTHHLATRTHDLAERLVATIEHDHPAYQRSGVVSRADLRHSCHTNMTAVLNLMVVSFAHGRPLGDDAVYAPARTTGALRAEQGLPLDDLLRSFRIGGRLIWDDMVTEGAQRLDERGLREVGSLLWEVVDETSAQTAAAYHDRERSRVRSNEQRRAALWEGLLNGRGRDRGFALEAAHLLDLPPTGDLVVLLTDVPDATAVERALAPHALALTLRGEHLVGVVALRDDSPDPVHAALQELTVGGEGPRIAVSAVVDGLAAVGDGHRQARTALRTARGTTAFVRYDQVLPEALLLQVPEVSRMLLDRWVRPLRALGEEGDLLLDTLAAWVSTGGSAGRAAPLVPCHRNTVLNRLRRVTQVTGIPLDDDAPPVDLDLALRARGLDRRAARPPLG